MEIYFDGFEVYEPFIENDANHSSYHISYMGDIDTIGSLCETAIRTFHLLTTISLHKVNFKHHDSMSKGEKEHCMNVIFEVWKSSLDEDIFYQALVSRICLSQKVATHMIELLNDIEDIEDIEDIRFNDVPL
jgi:hypothetical protein